MEEGLQGRLGRRPVLYGALIVFGVVLAVSVLGRVVLELAPAPTTDGENALLRAVESSILNLAGVALVALLLSRLGWWREVGFVGPSQWRSLRLLALPAVLGAVSVAGGLVNLDLSDPGRLALGLPTPFFTGFWEEGLTRGVLLSLLLVAALRSGRGPVGAVVLSASVFGLMHLIYLLQNENSLPEGLAQAVLATLIGITFGALLLRTNALWLLVILHASFDIDSVLVGTTGDDESFETVLLLALVPLTVYSLFLLRRVKSGDQTAAPGNADAPGSIASDMRPTAKGNDGLSRALGPPFPGGPMRVKSRVLLAPFTVVALVMISAATPAHAAFKQCKKGKAPLCGVVSVPLDRSGQMKGSVKLSVVRVPARKAPAAGTIMYLAGGPGQGAIDSIDAYAPLRKGLPNYDFVTFDQRGTGASGQLRCKGLALGSGTKAVAKCAKALGPRRGYYRSYDSSEDIEAVRQAIGSPKLSLYSISYGGRVAGEYVRRHPDSVARQVLDSPTSLNGTDPFSRQIGQALPRALNSLTPGTATLLSRLATKLAKRPLRGSVVTSKGRRKRMRLRQRDLYTLVVSLDLDPFTRGQFPGAAAAALKGDTAPLLRLAAGGGSADEVGKAVSLGLFFATSCAEAPLPWDTAQPPGKARLTAVNEAVKRLGRAPFAPFSPSAVIAASGFVGPCLAWPATPAAPAIPVPPAPVPAPAPPPPAAPPAMPQPPPDSPAPPPRRRVRGQAAQATAGQSSVPTLILEGAEDTRTPLEQARRIAAGYSAASLLTIPYTGHSTFGVDLAKCAPAAAVLFLGGGAAPAACPAKPRPEATPVITAFPASLSALGRRRSRRARTVLAAKLTVADVGRELNRVGSGFGGLRGGRASMRKKTVRLTGYQYLRGVRVTGRLRASEGGLAGSVRIAGGGTVPARVTFKGSKVKARFAGAGGASSASVSRWNPPQRAPRLYPMP